ncbi:hypothetical protein QJS66_09610 [Kocuria rhizophila]|nr:hypothetical protein QJS66_09610 [Kocuria rhizophila]
MTAYQGTLQLARRLHNPAPHRRSRDIRGHHRRAPRPARRAGRRSRAPPSHAWRSLRPPRADHGAVRGRALRARTTRSPRRCCSSLLALGADLAATGHQVPVGAPDCLTGAVGVVLLSCGVDSTPSAPWRAASRAPSSRGSPCGGGARSLCASTRRGERGGARAEAPGAPRRGPGCATPVCRAIPAARRRAADGRLRRGALGGAARRRRRGRAPRRGPARGPRHVARRCGASWRDGAGTGGADHRSRELLRLLVGIENVEDLWSDLAAGLDALADR